MKKQQFNNNNKRSYKLVAWRAWGTVPLKKFEEIFLSFFFREAEKRRIKRGKRERREVREVRSEKREEREKRKREYRRVYGQ